MPTSIPAYQRQDAHWMRQALLEAKKAAQLGEIPVGAVIVRDNQVIARAHNRRELDQDALAHAEVLCIRQACQTLHSWRLSGCQLYVTLEPCPMCAGAVINARLSTVIYGAKEPRSGSVGSVINLFEENYGHRPAVYGGVLSEDCARLLAEFFRGIR